jgi:hypothetical protein
VAAAVLPLQALQCRLQGMLYRSVVSGALRVGRQGCGVDRGRADSGLYSEASGGLRGSAPGKGGGGGGSPATCTHKHGWWVWGRGWLCA